MTFAVNYVGEPFNTPMAANRLFYASVRWSAAMYVLLVLDLPRGEEGWEGAIWECTGRHTLGLGCLASCAALSCRWLPQTAWLGQGHYCVGNHEVWVAA
jgi:hypothetical protein